MPTKTKNTKTAASTNDGRVLIGGFFAPEVRMELKMICATRGITLQALLTEGINLILTKYGDKKKRIA
jgi:hypothetical protein